MILADSLDQVVRRVQRVGADFPLRAVDAAEQQRAHAFVLADFRLKVLADRCVQCRISVLCQLRGASGRQAQGQLVFGETSHHDAHLLDQVERGLVDLGNRFLLIINTVDCKKTEKPMPKLPVATNFWTPQPDLYTGAEAWILAGGAHHTAFTYDLTAEQMGEWAAMMGIEAVFIDNDTTIRNFKKDLMLGNIFYK